MVSPKISLDLIGNSERGMIERGRKNSDRGRKNADMRCNADCGATVVLVLLGGGRSGSNGRPAVYGVDARMSNIEWSDSLIVTLGSLGGETLGRCFHFFRGNRFLHHSVMDVVVWRWWFAHRWPIRSRVGLP